MKKRIEDLWRYLEIPNDEKLIVPVYNPDTCMNEYWVVAKNEECFSVEKWSDNPVGKIEMPYQMVQQLDSEGHFVFPNPDQMKEDKISDY